MPHFEAEEVNDNVKILVIFLIIFIIIELTASYFSSFTV